MTTNLTRKMKARNSGGRPTRHDREKPLNGVLSFRRGEAADEQYEMFRLSRDGVYGDEV